MNTPGHAGKMRSRGGRMRVSGRRRRGICVL